MKKIIIYSIITSILIGIIISVLTGVYQHPHVLGANWWGLPLHWMSKAVLAPEYTPQLIIHWLNLLFDIIIWSVVVFLIFLVIFRKKLVKKTKNE